MTALNLLFTSENASYEITEDDNDKTKTVLLHKEDNIENSNKLQLQVMQLKQQVKDLNSQLSVQNQLVNNRAGVAILKLVGPGPYPPKKVMGPGPGFTLFPPKSGGARAQPAHTATPAL